MELAGLSCAQALQDTYPDTNNYSKVLVCCGPGNQVRRSLVYIMTSLWLNFIRKGGDGLVAARHLWHFGYKPTLFYPKQGNNEFYQKLKKQCLNLKIPEIGATDAALHDFKKALSESHLIMDAIFGFSFHGDPRPPFDTVLTDLKATQIPIVSVDVPSGWTVEEGDPEHKFFSPGNYPVPSSGLPGLIFAVADVLVSLTAPKLGVKAYKGKHYLGGRFVPP